MPKVVVGLIKGRHQLPVEQYLFDSIDDMFDYRAMESHINDFLARQVGICSTVGIGINQMDETDVELFCGQKEIICYVTGLTSVTAALVACCARNGVALTLMHFNAESGEYVPQKLL